MTFDPSACGIREEGKGKGRWLILAGREGGFLSGKHGGRGKAAYVCAAFVGQNQGRGTGTSRRLDVTRPSVHQTDVGLGRLTRFSSVAVL